MRCLFRPRQGYMCSCNIADVLLQHTLCALATHHMFSRNTPYVLLQHSICALATHHMFSRNTPYFLLQNTICSPATHHMDPWNPRQDFLLRLTVQKIIFGPGYCFHCFLGGGRCSQPLSNINNISLLQICQALS